jgi:hypothetical protein
VDAAGVVRARRSGAAAVTARAGAAAREVPVEVALYAALRPLAESITLPVGRAESLGAEILDDTGARVPGPVRWTSADPAVARVEPGQVVGMRTGSTTLTARAGGLATQVAVTVTPPLLGSLRASPAAVELGVGETRRVAVEALGEAGDPLAGAALRLAWISSAPGRAAVSPDGVVLGVAPGPAEVIATDGASGRSVAVPVAVLGRRGSARPGDR